MSSTAVLSLMQLLIFAGAYVWVSLALLAVFGKTGSARWKAWIPVVRQWELFRLAGMKPIWSIVLFGGGIIFLALTATVTGRIVATTRSGSTSSNAEPSLGMGIVTIVLPLLMLVAFLVFSLIIVIKMIQRVNRRFLQGAGFTALGIFLHPVWLSVLGWGRSQWQEEAAPQEPIAPAAPPVSPFQMGQTTQSPVASATPVVPVAPISPITPPVVTAPPVSPAPPRVSAVTPVVADPAPKTTKGWAPPASPAPFSPAEEKDPETLQDLVSTEDHTVLAQRHRQHSTLVLPTGEQTELIEQVVIIGRNPVAPDTEPGAQLIAVIEETKTISKTHAKLVRDATGWQISDLRSTNGVYLIDDQGHEYEITETTDVRGLFVLGDAEFELQ